MNPLRDYLSDRPAHPRTLLSTVDTNGRALYEDSRVLEHPHGERLLIVRGEDIASEQLLVETPDGEEISLPVFVSARGGQAACFDVVLDPGSAA